jgi:hypothetical protein
VTETPSAVATQVATPEPAPTEAATVTETATPAATPSPAVTATATLAPVSDAPVLTARRPQPTRRVRAAPTPPPEPTPTPPDQITGASLTLCHYVNPGYVAVTISADQYSLYYEEKDDIIPAPTTGCDNVDPDNLPDEGVTGCHLLADGTYSYFSYPLGDLHGHEFHKGDLVPAPNGMCPGADGEYVIPTPTAVPTTTATATATPDEGDVQGTDEGDEEDEGTDDPCFGGCGEIESDNRGGVLNALAAGTEAGAPTPSQLPFTGFDLWLIAVAGLALTMMGAGLRLLAAQPPVGVTR